MDAALEKRLKRQVIGKPHLFLAVVPLGFEQTLAEELTSISQESPHRHPEPQGEGSSHESISFHVIGDGKVEFTAKITDAWKAVAYTRIANRVLMHIADFKAENFRELEKKAAEIPWELYLPSGPVNPDTVAIHVTCKHSRLYHSDAVAERLYNVIGESLHNCHSGAGGDRVQAAATSSWRPQSRHLLAFSAELPQNLYVNFLDDRCTLWLDLAGEELYKRGHERHVNDAPLKETIAAGMLHEILRLRATPSAQDDTRLVAAPITLIDPMAGSGTFSLEAAYRASGLIPGVCRDFALKHQPAFKPATWNFIVNSEATASIASPIRKILTSDVSERAVEIIRHNVECSPLAQAASKATQGENAPAIAPAITPMVKDFFSYTAEEIADACPAGTQPAIVLNPPYGKRLDCDAPELYTQIGRKLSELSRSLKAMGKPLAVAILSPRDDTRNGARFTCTANLLRECPMLDPAQNPQARSIVTSHGGLTLNALFATL